MYRLTDRFAGNMIDAVLAAMGCGSGTTTGGTAVSQQLLGPFWGNVIVAGITGVITIGCFAAMFWFIFRPGEKGRDHAKYDILRHDR